MAEEKVEKIEAPEATPKKEKSPKKKKSGGIGCLVVLLIIILTPILVLIGMYMLSHDFQLFANSYLSSLPGSLGEKFEAMPTRRDELEDVRKVAKSLIKLDDERIMDKLKFIKSEDRRVYDDLVKELMRLNPNRVSELLDKMRRDGESDDLLEGVMNELESDKQGELQRFTDYLNALSIDSAVEELEIVCMELGGIELAASYIDLMEEERAMKIIYRMSNDNKNKIFAMLSEEKSVKLKAEYDEYQLHNRELEQIAGLMKKERGSVIAKNLEKYNDDDKVIILRNLGPRVAGLALSYMDNDERAIGMVNKIKNAELEDNDKDEITSDILKALKVYRDFDDNITELRDVYLKMDTHKVASVIKDMCINPGPDRVYYLDNGDNIEISDIHLATEILRGYPQKKLAEILSGLDDTLASELTRRLALPK